MPVDGEPERILVELDVATDDVGPGGRFRACGATDDVFYPEDELVDVEGFGDVVVGADLEPIEPISLFITGGEEEEWDAEAGVHDLVGQLEAVHFGHGNVDKGEMKSRLGIFKLVECDAAVLCPAHFEANDLEVLLDDISEIDLVFD